MKTTALIKGILFMLALAFVLIRRALILGYIDIFNHAVRFAPTLVNTISVFLAIESIRLLFIAFYKP